LGALLQGYLDPVSISDFKFTSSGVAGGIMDVDAVASDIANNPGLAATCDLLLPAGGIYDLDAVMLVDADNAKIGNGISGVAADEKSSTQVSAHDL
jgi:hypothetical protein